MLGDVCRVLTVRRDHYEDDKKNVDIEVPAIDVQLGGADWADSVNQLIQATVNAEVAQSEARAEEYYDAFIATGRHAGGVPSHRHRCRLRGLLRLGRGYLLRRYKDRDARLGL